jgi:Bacterial Ig domain
MKTFLSEQFRYFLKLAMLCAWISISSAADLTINSGVVVKFGADGELVSRDSLKTQGEVVFTSINDNTVGGTTIANAPAPQSGSWIGITLAPSATVANTALNSVEIRYAGGGSGAALSMPRLPYVFEGIALSNNLFGIKISAAGSNIGPATIRDSVLVNNQTAVQSEGSTPRIENSELTNNTAFGVQNLSPAQIVLARQNWWGHPSGPRDTVANPNGLGSPVSTGVDYGQFLTSAPLIACGVRAANGVYAVTRRSVTLALRCRNATSYRLSESTTFSGNFVPMAATTNFLLSAAAGNKTVYAEFRGDTNQTRVVSTPQAFVLTPNLPNVSFDAPAENAVLTTNIVIRVTATDAIGVSAVEFRANDQLLGVDSSAPYEWNWDISAIADGAYTLKATATNNDETSAFATRNVRVERASPQPDTYNSPEGDVLFVDPPGILANDQVNVTTAIIDIVDQPAWGTLTMTGSGGFVFRPDTADRNGSTTFRYRVRSGTFASNPILVTLNITPVNDAPDAKDDSYLTDENVELVVAAPGVKTNDLDVDSSALTPRVLTTTAHGLLTLRPDGSFNYVPEVNYRGIDSFTYELKDADGAIDSAQVDIVVSQAPTATNDVYLLDVDQYLQITVAEEGLLENDFDLPELDPLTPSVLVPPANGVLQLFPNGTFNYRPNAGFQGLDPFSYRVSDGRSNSNTATVTMAVGVTNLPRANTDSYDGLEDQELIVNATDGLLSNDTDQDTPREQLQAFLVGYDDLLVSSIVVNLDGSFKIKARQNFNGVMYFTYELYDGTNRSNVARVKVDFKLVNDGVDAVDDIYGVRQNQILVVPGSGSSPIWFNDRYDDDFRISYTLVTPPEFGVATLSADGKLTYSPSPGFSGTDQLTYRASQIGTDQSDTAIVRIRTNAPPIARPDAYTIDEDTSVSVTPSLLANDSDPDNDPLRMIGGYAGDSRYVRVDWNNAINPSLFTAIANQHFYGVRTFLYTISDGIYTAESQITLTVRPVPEAPLAIPESYLTQRNTTLTVTDTTKGILANDFDPDTREYATAPVWQAAQGVDLQPFTMQLVSTTPNGALTLNADGTFNYVPNQNFSGLDTFRYQLTDATGRVSAPGVVSIRVNTPPLAAPEAYTINEDTLLSISATNGVLINDTDVDGDTLYAEYAGSNPCSPCQGQLVLRFDGSFTYKAKPNYFGTDKFFYRSTDPYRAFAVGEVNLTILPVNDAPIPEPDSYRVDEDNPLVAAAALGLLRNDEEVDGETLGGAVVTRQPTNGSVILQTSGGFSYTPNSNWSGRDTLRYRVYDQSGLFAEDEAVIFVDPVNDAPVAAADSYATVQDQTLNVAPANGVLANDTDIDSTSLTAALLSTTANGLLTLRTDGSFTYQPNGVFAGIDTFEYQLSDERGAVASARVSITVTDMTDPVEITVADDEYVVNGASLTIAAPGVLANDSVTGAPSLSATLLSPPNRGSVQLSVNGAFVFTAPANFVGSTSFTYTANAAGQTAIGLVSLQINNSTNNLMPTVQGEQFGMFEDSELDSASVGSVLSNDRDPENQSLSAILVDSVTRGTLALRSNGHFTYRPQANIHGTDRFRYRVSDGVNQSEPVTASITILAQNDPPIAADDSYQGLRNQSLSVAADVGVLANDRDIDADPLTVELVDAPSHGQLTMSADGAFVYQPAAGFVGNDQFRYALTDGQARDLGIVSLRIIGSTNQAPVALGESYTFNEDIVLRSGGAVVSLLANDSDPDGDVLSVQIITQPIHGQLQLDGDQFSYTPAANYFGADQFSYAVSDGALQSATVTTTLAVTAVNDAPIAMVDRYLITQASVLTVSAGQGVLANDLDVENQPLSASVHTQPAHGTLSLQNSGAFVYTPLATFSGRDEFSYRVSDGTASAIGRVAIDITALVNQRPIAIGESFVIPEDSVLDTLQLDSLLANDRDPEGQPLTLRITEPPPRGVLTTMASGHIRYQPARDDVGSVSFEYVANDGVLDSLPVRVQIQISPVNDAPVATSDVYNLPSSGPLTVSALQGVLVNDNDPDGDTLVSTVLQPPAFGSLNLSLNGGFIYTPGTTSGAVSFSYRVRDPLLLESVGQVTINVAAPVAEPIFKNGFEAAQ